MTPFTMFLFQSGGLFLPSGRCKCDAIIPRQTEANGPESLLSSSPSSSSRKPLSGRISNSSLRARRSSTQAEPAPKTKRCSGASKKRKSGEKKSPNNLSYTRVTTGSSCYGNPSTIFFLFLAQEKGSLPRTSQSTTSSDPREGRGLRGGRG